MTCEVQHPTDSLPAEPAPSPAHTVALPLVFPNPVTIAQKMDHVFEKLKAKPVIKRLQELGYSEVYAQKACLMYCAQKKNNALLETSALLNWINFEAKPEDIEKPITLADLLEHLDIDGAVQKLTKSVPGVSPQTVELAATFSLGDVAAAEQLLTVPVQGSTFTGWDGIGLETCLNNVWHYDNGTTGLPHLQPAAQKHHQQQQQQPQQQQTSASGEVVDAAQLQAAAALMMSAAGSSEPAAPTTPPSAPSPPSAPHSPARTVSPKVKSTTYSGRKRSSCSSNSNLSSSLPLPTPTFSIPTTSTFQVMPCSASTTPTSTSGIPPPGSASGIRLGLSGSAVSSPVRVFGAPNLGIPAPPDDLERADWEAEKRSLTGQVTDLQKHKEWADSRIRDLIKKACEAEKPLAEENRGLREELAKCQEDQVSLGGRVRELEDSLARLKEGCFREAAARRDVERRVAEAQAEAQAALLREGELQQQLEAVQAQVKGLKKSAATAEKQRQKLAEEKADAEQKLEQLQRQVPQLQRKLEAAEKLANERGEQLEAVEKEKGGALAYAKAQASAWEASHRRTQEEVAKKEQELKLAQARIETLQQADTRLRAEARQAQSELLVAQTRLKEAESRSTATGRLFMDGHWSAPDFLGRAGIGLNRGGSWSPDSTERPSSPDSRRLEECERKVAMLTAQLQLERTRGRDELEEAQGMNSNLLLHSKQMMEERDKLRQQLRSMGATPRA